MTTNAPDPEREQDRLDDLQDRIDEVREDVNNATDLDDERRFIDDGEKSDAVDDTIAPG
jgi:hypothetical protein